MKIFIFSGWNTVVFLFITSSKGWLFSAVTFFFYFSGCYLPLYQLLYQERQSGWYSNMLYHMLSLKGDNLIYMYYHSNYLLASYNKNLTRFWTSNKLSQFCMSSSPFSKLILSSNILDNSMFKWVILVTYDTTYYCTNQIVFLDTGVKSECINILVW
jgi:hypothetical protein